MASARSSRAASRATSTAPPTANWRALARMAKALAALGVQQGDRVATLAWNGYRHMELYYAVSGSGAVLHTHQPAPAPRPDRLDRRPRRGPGAVLRPHLPAAGGGWRRHEDRCALRADDRPRAHAGGQPRIDPGLLCYEDLIEAEDDRYDLARVRREHASELCYTSAPPATPRACCTATARRVLHAYAAALPDALGCSARDVVLPVVPMFHVNAWGLPYVARHGRRQAGAARAGLDGKSLYELFESERGRHLLGRRAHRLAGPAGLRGGQRPEAFSTMRAR
jgi:acyl-CoA synthetase (AMP-forming)/AMP-acid ligase II